MIEIDFDKILKTAKKADFFNRMGIMLIYMFDFVTKLCYNITED